MGDIKKHTKKYLTPSSAFSKERIDSEKELMREYGLKNKKEIWRVQALLRGMKDQAKKAVTNEQVQKEKELLYKRLVNLGLLKSVEGSDSILSLEVKDILDRRLQTIVYKKGLARTVDQARQFIVHEHIHVAGKKISRPGYLVRSGEEQSIDFTAGSVLSDPEHIERSKEEKKEKKKPEQNEKRRPGKKRN
jgi:small subunit ribosomal protein S4